MSSSCEKTNSINLGCHPYLTIGCIISCAVCTIAMIWGVYAMRVDMAHMEKMMTPSLVGNTDPMQEHCRSMPEMIGCEKYR